MKESRAAALLPVGIASDVLAVGVACVQSLWRRQAGFAEAASGFQQGCLPSPLAAWQSVAVGGPTRCEKPR
jgi:hypothetical protein